jgi:hypothetical protein
MLDAEFGFAKQYRQELSGSELTNLGMPVSVKI